jgi:hypothetical protein
MPCVDFCNQKQDMKQEWTLQQIELLLAGHAASGLSKKDFLISRGINPATFYYWQKRLREDAPAGFIQVAEAPSYAEVEVYIENIGWLALRGKDPASLAQAVIALKSACNA